MKSIYIILLALASGFIIQSCDDIIDIEENVDKELLYKPFTSSDSLSLLEINNLDFGKVKVRTVSHAYVNVVNLSDTNIIEIFSIESTDKTGLFSYTFPQGFPFKIDPGENTGLTKKILVKFVADALNLGAFEDTLIFNDNKDFYAIISAEVRYR